MGVLGPNGAGKTTVFNLITGGLAPDSGAIRFNGQDITRLAPHRRCRAGIGRSYQVALPFEGMTVFENLLVGAMYGAERHSPAEANDRCVDLLDRTSLLDKANRLAGSLTLLDRKRLELARALATEPELLLLDEIAGGLTEAEAHALIELVNDIRRSGVSIVWIEHVVHALLAVASRLLVINFGAKLAEGDPRDGDGQSGRQTRLHGHRHLGGHAMLQVRNLEARYGDFQALFGVDFDLEQGTIVALIGANGAGKSTFLKSIAGQMPMKSGEIRFNSEDIGAHAVGSRGAPRHFDGSRGAAALPQPDGRREPEGRGVLGPRRALDARDGLCALSRS